MATDVALANRAWESLMTAHTVRLRGFAAEGIWRAHGISMREYDVLYTLAKHEAGAPVGENTGASAGARIGDLQSDVLLSQPALSRMVDRLEDRGLVERVADMSDGRAVRVRLSPTGRETQRAVGRAHARSVARAVGGALTLDELHELQRLTAKLAATPAANPPAANPPAAAPPGDPGGGRA